MSIITELEKKSIPKMPKNKSYRIGIVGAGFIVKECHLVAYRKLGLNPVAITSLSYDESMQVAKQFSLERVHRSWKELIDDESIEVIDIAVPPHIQLEIVEYACNKKHIKAILCQKPIAMDYETAKNIAALGEQSGKRIAVNSNMRYDQSIRALKYCVDNGYLGKPVLASYEQRAVPHWQDFVKAYGKLTFLNFSIHEIDSFRYIFGNPKSITAHCTQDPRVKFEHNDGITQFTFTYEDGLLATSLDDTFAFPESDCVEDKYIKFRACGTEGLAKGTIGWTHFPKLVPSTFELNCRKNPKQILKPTWETSWFPDAFGGTMSSLLYALENGIEPETSAKDHAITIACVDACYKSIEENRTIELNEMI